MKWIGRMVYSIKIIDTIMASFWYYGSNEYAEAFVKVYFAFLNLFVITSGLLYIPIAVSIYKLLHLASAQQNKPQRYVIWQSSALLAMKLMSAVIFFINSPGNFAMSVSMTFEAIFFPLVVQMIYIGCNRRNLHTMISHFHWKKLWRMFCCPCFSSPEVAPVRDAQMYTTMAANPV